MRRIVLAALGASLVALAAPGAALAHHSRHHAACARTHRHHAKCAHARAHVLSFGPIAATPTSGAPTTPSPTSSTETAGVVKSFEAPVLTITLNDKTEVSGKVTEATRLECESPATSGEGDDDAQGESSGEDGAGTHGDARIADFHSGDEGQSGDEGGGDDGGPQPCTAASLKEGAVVRAAELVLGSGGAIWEKVILVS